MNKKSVHIKHPATNVFEAPKSLSMSTRYIPTFAKTTGREVKPSGRYSAMFYQNHKIMHEPSSPIVRKRPTSNHGKNTSSGKKSQRADKREDPPITVQKLGRSESSESMLERLNRSNHSGLDPKNQQLEIVSIDGKGGFSPRIGVSQDKLETDWEIKDKGTKKPHAV